MEIRLTSSGNLDDATRQIEKSFRSVQRTLGREIAKVARKAILDDVKGRRRGGLSFSGMHARLSTKSEIQPRGMAVDVTMSARPAGPWAIVERGAAPHVIRARRGEGGLFVAGQFFEEVHHPGTTGLHVWDGAEPALDRAVGPAIEDVFDEAIEDA